MRRALVALLLSAACASAPVVTREAPEVFGPEHAARMAAHCAAELPLAEEQCQCMAVEFIGAPLRMEQTQIQALIDKAWAKCVGPEPMAGQVEL